MKDKKIIIILSIIAIILIIIGINKFNNNSNTNKTNTKNKIEYNTNKNFTEDKNIDNISFTNIKCSYDGKNSLLEYTITNNKDTSIILNEYELIIKDKDNNILAIIAPVLEQEILPNTSYEASDAIDIDLTKANTLELKLNNN